MRIQERKLDDVTVLDSVVGELAQRFDTVESADGIVIVRRPAIVAVAGESCGE